MSTTIVQTVTGFTATTAEWPDGTKEVLVFWPSTAGLPDPLRDGVLSRRQQFPLTECDERFTLPARRPGSAYYAGQLEGDFDVTLIVARRVTRTRWRKPPLVTQDRWVHPYLRPFIGTYDDCTIQIRTLLAMKGSGATAQLEGLIQKRAELVKVLADLTVRQLVRYEQAEQMHKQATQAEMAARQQDLELLGDLTAKTTDQTTQKLLADLDSAIARLRG